MWHYCIKMEFQKIVNLFDTTSDDKYLPRFFTKKWIEVYDQSGENYNVNEEIRTKTSMLRLDLCDFNDSYIVVKGTITVTNPDNAKRNKVVAFKNNAPFINCNSKIKGVKIDNAEDLDVVMTMYNLLEYSKNYRKTTGRLCNYYRDEPSNLLSYNAEPFKYKTSIQGNTYNVGADKDDNDASKVSKNEAKVIIPLKHLSGFWRSLNIPLILTWSKNCILADMTTRDAEGNNPAIVAPSGLEFKITDAELYVRVVTLSKENDVKLLEQLKSGFKRTIKWKKYRSQMTVHSNNNNLNYLTDRTFTNVNRLFVLSFTRNNAGDNRDSFSDYYVPKVKINDFNVLTDGKSFFDLPVKNEEEAYEKTIDMSNNNDYTTGFCLFQKKLQIN